MASGLAKMHTSQFSTGGFLVPTSEYCSQSLPAGDLMPSNASATIRRGHGAKQAPHSSTSSRAFYNSYYPAPPQHKPMDPSSSEVPLFNLPPSPSPSMLYDRPAELSPGSVQADGFPGSSEMSRSLTDFGANPLHAASSRSIPGSNSHSAVFESGADGLCSQIDGLNISAAPSSVFSVLSEHSQKQRESQSRRNQSVFSALSSANSSHQTSPNTTQRMSSMRSPSDSSSSSSILSRHGSTGSARASVSASNSVVEELFEFEMDQSDDMRPASSSNSSSAHSPHVAASMAALNSPWRGVM